MSPVCVSPSVCPSEVDADPRRSVSGGVLKLLDVEVADTAVYQCHAQNKHGSILLNTYINVVGKSSPSPVLDQCQAQNKHGSVLLY